MKICKIFFRNHPFFGTMNIDFTGPNGKTPLSTIVIGGINGSGKTTLLRIIPETLKKNEINPGRIYASIEWTFSNQPGYENPARGCYLQFQREYDSKFKDVEEKDKPQIIYMPTEINFDKIMIEIKPYVYTHKLLNIIDENFAGDIPTYFATYIDKYVYSQNKLPDESMKMACDDINSIFKELEIKSWIVGLKKDGSRMPLFQNELGKIFDINGLSSGERQLFFRIISLKMMDVSNSVILVDEPEISLHPFWQQKIIKVYENIGKNNQVIAATHSPHILSSVPKECVRLLMTTPEGVQVLDHNAIQSYGAPIKRILKDLMGLKTDRDPAIQSKIDELNDLLKQEDFSAADFENKFKELEDILGTIDEDLIRIRIEKLRKESRKVNAKDH